MGPHNHLQAKKKRTKPLFHQEAAPSVVRCVPPCLRSCPSRRATALSLGTHECVNVCVSLSLSVSVPLSLFLSVFLLLSATAQQQHKQNPTDECAINNQQTKSPKKERKEDTGRPKRKVSSQTLSFLGDCADTTTKERKWEKEARRASVEQVGKGKRLVGTRLTLPPPHQEGERARVSEERIEEERQKATNKRKNQIGKCSTKTGCLQNSFKCVQAVLF